MLCCPADVAGRQPRADNEISRLSFHAETYQGDVIMVQRMWLAALVLTLSLLPTSLAHAQVRYGAGRVGYPGAYGYGYGYGYPIGVGSHIPNVAGSPYLYGYNLF